MRRREGYTHHGIYLGEGRVAHFSDESGLVAKTSASVVESSLEDFLQGGGLLRRRHIGQLSREEVVARARAVLRGDRPWQPYHLVRNNCEHFATYCATRRSRSVQVRQVAGAAAVTTAIFAVRLVRKRFSRFA